MRLASLQGNEEDSVGYLGYDKKQIDESLTPQTQDAVRVAIEQGQDGKNVIDCYTASLFEDCTAKNARAMACDFIEAEANNTIQSEQAACRRAWMRTGSGQDQDSLKRALEMVQISVIVALTKDVLRQDMPSNIRNALLSRLGGCSTKGVAEARAATSNKRV